MTTTQTRPDLSKLRPTHTTVGLVLVHDGKVLLQRQPKDAVAYANTWDLPTADAVGAPEDAVLEGAQERLGVEVTAFSLHSAVDDVVGEDCWRRFVYRVESFTGEVVIKDAGLRWYTEKEFADVFQLKPAARRYPTV